MIPSIHKVNLKLLPARQREKICSCSKPCLKGITITTYNDGMMMCWHDARRHLMNLKDLLDVQAYATWSEEEEQYIINHYKEHGVYKGINRHIANVLGKEYRQVKSKTTRMKQKGLI